jgi:hypothetical protein
MTIWIVSGVAAFYASICVWLGFELWRAPLVGDDDHFVSGKMMDAANNERTVATGLMLAIAFAILLLFVMPIAISRMVKPASSHFPPPVTQSPASVLVSKTSQQLLKPQPPPPELLEEFRSL